MNTTFVGIELKRILRNGAGLFFIAGLPAVMYVVFGAAQSYKDETVGSGNVAMYIMISMAAYGAVTATTNIGGTAAVERMLGWGRQLGLTPLRDSGYIAMKAITAIAIAIIPVALIYVIGGLTGAKGDASSWVVSAILVIVASAIFALFGLAIGAGFRSETAVSAAGGTIVVLAFLGNVFIPLSGVMLDIGRFTPLYGVVALARYPLTEGRLTTDEADSLGLILANVGVWTVIFAIAAVLLVRKGRQRQ
ncbi:ABC transporter permease [Cumulibacter soli]|uniref:ABC transporter permease n=1 Tax=Cumulibacter soli TaxID=2546344 RepID=UPI0010685090|nr:ABC transporter permease [Cumulibacter soli]